MRVTPCGSWGVPASPGPAASLSCPPQQACTEGGQYRSIDKAYRSPSCAFSRNFKVRLFDFLTSIYWRGMLRNYSLESFPAFIFTNITSMLYELVL
jgi:hypothetical protein